MNSRVLIIIIVLVIIVGAGGVIVLLRDRSNTSPTPTPTTTTTTTNNPAVTTISTSSILNADAAAEAENSKKRFTSAQEKLRQWSLWHPDTEFSGLFMTFDATLELNSANEVYVFDSLDDPDNHFTVSVAQSSGNILRAIVPVSDYQGALKPIKKEFWQSNYIEAIQFAHQNGGKVFSDANKITSIDAHLYRTTPNDYLYWVVTYHTSDANTKLTIKIDAKDKTLVTE